MFLGSREILPEASEGLPQADARNSTGGRGRCNAGPENSQSVWEEQHKIHKMHGKRLHACDTHFLHHRIPWHCPCRPYCSPTQWYCASRLRKSRHNLQSTCQTRRARHIPRLTALLRELRASKDKALVVAERDASLVGHGHRVRERRRGKSSTVRTLAVQHTRMSATSISNEHQDIVMDVHEASLWDPVGRCARFEVAEVHIVQRGSSAGDLDNEQ